MKASTQIVKTDVEVGFCLSKWLLVALAYHSGPRLPIPARAFTRRSIVSTQIDFSKWPRFITTNRARKLDLVLQRSRHNVYST